MPNSTTAVKLDRKTAPKPGIPKDVHFPEYYETKTKNGITLLVIENHKIPAVSVRLVFKNAGSFYDEGKYGLAMLTGELLNKGTINRSASELAGEIDFLGATLNAGADWDGSYASLSCLKKHLPKAIDILADVILNPAFREDDIKRIKEQRISSIIQGKDDASNLSDKLFSTVVFDKHPYAFPAEGTELSVNNLSQAEFRDYYSSHYNPSNLILAFVGSVSTDEALKITEDKFSVWQPQTIASINNNYAFNSEYSPKNVYIAEKTGAVQSSLRVGHIGIERNNPDYIAVTVLNTILGGFFGSRINYNLREKNGYTYGARSGFNSRIHKGDFAVETEVRTEVTYKAVKIILDELKRITDELVTDEELLLVKNYLSGIFPLQLETANAVATRAINLKLYELQKDYYSTYISNISKITKDDILKTAQKYLFPGNSYVVISGDSSAVRNEMSKLGEVNVYDPDGNLI